MQRLTPALVATGLLAFAFLSIGAAAIMAMPTDGHDDAPQASHLEIYMSDEPDGPQRRSFVSDTNRIFAVVYYEDAEHEQYDIRLRDLSGIEVFRAPVDLYGTGTASKEIAIDDFVNSYRAGITLQGGALDQTMDDLTGYCQNPPPPPSPWPPPPPANPTPGAPTPTPTGYDRWRTLMLDGIESANTMTAELIRTLRALGGLPDVQESESMSDDIAAAVALLLQADDKLDQAERKVNPRTGTGPGTPTPDPPEAPDPDGACQLVGEADALVTEALDRSASALNAIPEDTSTWRLPVTSARYDDGSFASCLQYDTDLLVVDRDTAADSTSWTVGDPGEPALMFPGPDLVDQSNLGQLAISPRELYASSVAVPGVVREADVRAFVTDDQCIPIGGTTVTFGTDPSWSGLLAPEVADIDDGLAKTRLTAGVSPTLGSEVVGYVCVGDCLSPPVVGRGTFSVIGPPRMLLFKVNPDRINPVLDERANISVRAMDANGRHVADGTQITVSIAAGDPGVLARDVRPRAAPTPQPELLGKSAHMVTVGGFSNVPPGDDPGLIYSPDLYLMAAGDGEGPVELRAVAENGVEATPEIVFIESRMLIYMPLALRAHNVLATPPRMEPETATPTP